VRKIVAHNGMRNTDIRERNMIEYGHFIGGKQVAGKSGRTADVFQPMDGTVRAHVALASKAEVRAAVENAKAAQGAWAAVNPQRRARVLMKFLDLIAQNNDELADTLAREKWTKANLRARIQEVTSRPLRELLRDDDSGEGIPPGALGTPTEEQLAEKIAKFRKPEDINIIVAGGNAGKFSAVFAGWVSGPMGSSSVSRRIEETA